MAEAVEMLDILDKNGNKTGRLHRRGEKLNNGEYVPAIHVWIKNSCGNFLISKRSPEKWLGGLWECTRGSVIAGEESFTAALREVKEELGFTLSSKGERVYSYNVGDCFLNVWLFCEDFDINDVVLQECETCAAKWIAKDEIIKIIDSGEFIPIEYMPYIYDMLEKF